VTSKIFRDAEVNCGSTRHTAL